MKQSPCAHARVRVFRLAVISLLAGLAGFAGPGARAAKPVIYHLDLRTVWGMSQTYSYDTQHTAVCVQGLANREAPRVFITFSDADMKWLTRIQEPGALCEGWEVRKVAGVKALIELFRSRIKGVVVYDGDATNGVISTSLVATTAAAVEGAIAVRKDAASSSMYQYLVNTLKLPVLIDLTGKFPGSGTIWQTATPSTGSRKCDAYLWAKEKYLDAGRCDPTVLSYSLDLWALKKNLGAHQYNQLANLDYAISRRGFCFELSPWGDEAPNDDPTQPLGTDLATFKAILNACNLRTARNAMIKFCGFTNWHLKYTDAESVGGKHGAVETEWETVRITSAYNVYLEADAPGANFVANASFYGALLPGFKSRRYVQNPAPTYAEMVARGLIDAQGQVVPGNYVMLGMGDYDQASWTLYLLAGERYDDPVRGQVDCNWAIDPNAIDRVCAAVDYMYRHKTARDTFISWDSGAGYVNPGQLYGARDPSGYPSGVAVWQRHCKRYYRTLDYSISAWLLNGSMALTTQDCVNAAPFSGDGIGLHPPANFSTPALVNNVPVRVLTGIINQASGVRFGWERTIIQFPHEIKATVDSYANSGRNHRFLDAYTYNYLMRYHRGGANTLRATWVGDTIPRVMATGHRYPVTVTVRNDGWDTWSEASLYRLAHAFTAPGVEAVNDDYDRNERHYLPAGATVAPGQSVTFSFELMAPQGAGNYELRYDMVKDGEAWFHDANNLEWVMDVVVAPRATDVDTDRDGVPDIVEDAQGTLYWHPDDAVAKSGVAAEWVHP